MRIRTVILLSVISTHLTVIPTQVAGGAPAPAGEQGPFYYYLGAPVSLGQRTDTIAVLDREGGSSDPLTRLLQDAAIPEPDVRPHPIGGGWHTVRYNALSVDAPPGIPSTISRLMERDAAGRFYFSPVYAGSGGGPLIVPPRILVLFEDALAEGDVARLLREAGAEGASREPFARSLGNAFKVATHDRSGIDVLAIANRLAEMPEVVFAEPDMIIEGRSDFVPTDPEFADSWGLLNTGQFPGSIPGFDVNVVGGWDFTLGSPEIVTVVIDVGVQQNHPDVNQIPGQDFTGQGGGGGPVNACDNHGTPVAGVITGRVNNARGTVGVAPLTKIASARTFISLASCDGRWTTEFSWTAAALQWADDIGARITNNSNSYDEPSNAITLIYKQTANGLLHFAAAGNIVNNETDITYPANLEWVHAVTAMDWDGELANLSRWGPEAAFTAPGRIILAPDRTGPNGYSILDTAFVSGTSFASPMVAGTAALLLSLKPTQTPFQVLATLNATARDLGAPGGDVFFGVGLVDADIALKAIALELIFQDDFETGDLSRWSSGE
jgi:subtilisin family serine protease